MRCTSWRTRLEPHRWSTKAAYQGWNTKGLRATIARGPKINGALRGPKMCRQRHTGPEITPLSPHGARNCAAGVEKSWRYSCGATRPRKIDWSREFYGPTTKLWVMMVRLSTFMAATRGSVACGTTPMVNCPYTPLLPSNVDVYWWGVVPHATIASLVLLFFP